MRELLKVTSFIVHERAHVLLLRHPNAGIQFPAGTIEDGETPATAALREAREETGLADFGAPVAAGEHVETLVPPASTTGTKTPVYFRPDTASTSWFFIRRGLGVTIERRHGDFAQITHEEFDQVPNPNYVTARVTGWVKSDTLAQIRRRHFFVLPFTGEMRPEWTQEDDGHVFGLFWAPIDALPPIIPPQDQWIPYLQRACA
jgi:8-oxo-dGTP pyrophosphatase MutT (NUDIX family)